MVPTILKLSTYEKYLLSLNKIFLRLIIKFNRNFEKTKIEWFSDINKFIIDYCHISSVKLSKVFLAGSPPVTPCLTGTFGLT